MIARLLCTTFFLTNLVIYPEEQNPLLKEESTPSTYEIITPDKNRQQTYCQSLIPLCGFLGENKNGKTSFHSGVLINNNTAHLLK